MELSQISHVSINTEKENVKNDEKEIFMQEIFELEQQIEEELRNRKKCRSLKNKIIRVTDNIQRINGQHLLMKIDLNKKIKNIYLEIQNHMQKIEKMKLESNKNSIFLLKDSKVFYSNKNKISNQKLISFINNCKISNKIKNQNISIKKHKLFCLNHEMEIAESELNILLQGYHDLEECLLNLQQENEEETCKKEEIKKLIKKLSDEIIIISKQLKKNKSKRKILKIINKHLFLNQYKNISIENLSYVEDNENKKIQEFNKQNRENINFKQKFFESEEAQNIISDLNEIFFSSNFRSKANNENHSLNCIEKKLFDIEQEKINQFYDSLFDWKSNKLFIQRFLKKY